MRKIVVLVGIILTVIFVYVKFVNHSQIISPLGRGVASPTEKKLAQYSYASLQKTTFPPGQIIIDKILKDDTNFTSYLFYFDVRGKKVSGLMNVPKNAGSYPVIIMIRGYVDQNVYQPGVGTSHGGALMAQNDLITIYHAQKN